MNSFADNLKRILKDRGLTVRDVAEKTGIPRSTLAEWTNNRQPHFSPELMKLSEALDVSLEYLLTGKTVEEQLIGRIASDPQKFIRIFSGIYRISIDKEEK